MHTVAQIWRLLSPFERRRALLLSVLMFAVGVVEVTGIISVVPLVAVLTSAADPCARLGEHAGAVCSRLLPTRDPYVLAALAFGLIAMSNVLAFLVVWFSARLNWAVWRRLAAHLFGIYLEKPYEYFFDVHSSVVVKNVVFETERFAMQVFMPTLVLLSRIIVTVAVVLLVVAVDPSVSFGIIAVLALLYAAVYRQLQGKVRSSGDVQFAARERISAVATETVAGVREVRMLGCGEHFAARLRRAADTLARQYVYSTVASVMPRYVIETAAFALILAVAGYLSHKLGGWQTAAPLLAFYIFSAYRLLPQFQQIYFNAMLVQQNASIVDALTRLVSAPSVRELPGRPHDVPTELRPPIRLNQVTYRYPGTAKPVLEQASMEIPALAAIGLVGATGSGKSTIIDLIAGLLVPQEGTIALNGTPLDAAAAPAWRTRIGYVPQVPYLLDDTIRRNIAFGLADDATSTARVERAARLANIHDFIAQLPQGYETFVGERGVRLSGGQRQRLVIARALYRDPEVLVFDEATSALDPETEQAVMDAIGTLAHQKTLLIISHRPATLQRCDLVYEVAGGKITAREPTALRSSA
jgi:ATP-binding cassette, subfamily B, bacterial PglK